jgi:ribokinase
VLNTAPAVEAGRELFALADVVVCNQPELAAYAGDAGTSVTAELRDVVVRLRARPEQVWVVTLGARGAVAVAGDDVVTVAGRVVDAVDTTGAGDCFTGALAARLAAGPGLTGALTFANAAASLAVGRPGAGVAMPTAAEIEAVLRV